MAVPLMIRSPSACHYFCVVTCAWCAAKVQTGKGLRFCVGYFQA